MAAVLAWGEGALLSHRDAAALWGLRDTVRSAIDVTVTGTSRRSRPRITIHSAAAIHADDRSEVDGIPVTSVARTLLDLAEVVSADQLRLAYEEAEKRRILDFRAVGDVVHRSNGRRGLAALLALLDYDPTRAANAKSDLESMFLDLVRTAALPLPQLNAMVEGFEVDAYWPGARLVAELQSYEHHAHRQAFERDHSKLARLRLAGYEVLAFTHRQLRDEAEWVVEAVRAMLERARVESEPAVPAANV
jgi:very-short-patch-repair endonuclease